MNRRKSLIRDVERAFADVSRGGGITIHEARLLDDVYHPTAEQLEAARSQDSEESWKEVPPNVVNKLSDTMPFFDAEGRRYYLPAFITFVLDPPDAFDESAAAGGVVYTLLSVDVHREEFDRYTTDQKNVLARFLQHMLEDDDWALDETMQAAFSDYWSRFLPAK